MGYDGTFVEVVEAPFAGLIRYAGVFNGWNGSHGLIIEAGAHVTDVDWWVPTRCVYFVEGIMPIVHSGEQVRGGQTIGHWYPSPYGDSYGRGSKGAIEFGVADRGPVGEQTNAYAISLGIGSRSAADMVVGFSDGCQKALGMKGPTSTDNAGRP